MIGFLPGLSFWLNWVIVFCFLGALALLAFTFLWMRRQAPGNFHSRQVVQQVRRMAELIYCIDVVILLVVLLKPATAASLGSGSVTLAVMAVMLFLLVTTLFLALACGWQAIIWRDEKHEANCAAEPHVPSS